MAKVRDRTISIAAEEEILGNVRNHLKGIVENTPEQKQEVCLEYDMWLMSDGSART